ncbi:hypothetical protein PHYBLDRAFT_150902 [Phycomyces blakesleeanus NRRL 1555(-)]|uniref:Uncharacterized protein n=1 Tax=Phycomyces blakesleeanus (strain ATCC 8743b / DSM 1359 / FGSC 10004 / NBRC 33097 / NRRL 1555) TaxID=763407 RepID=A0A162TKC7_PHYB8|nr:hypothetical protein PHYBLDRAFT_150902 [Phycomyces blakesleeanus NRRL 1555(-)]OAD67813.1 hypothetical protein PHYBLDRAFT_150902 [Phycomyces blakesleeanus NRRL 1555(-)]|eukprot:XP_018285853.1 hypothetical protein PHYBLDRAFT_150902 [Phycomyces blakesleeanus NRRL 1555(-)]
MIFWFSSRRSSIWHDYSTTSPPSPLLQLLDETPSQLADAKTEHALHILLFSALSIRNHSVVLNSFISKMWQVFRAVSVSGLWIENSRKVLFSSLPSTSVLLFYLSFWSGDILADTFSSSLSTWPLLNLFAACELQPHNFDYTLAFMTRPCLPQRSLTVQLGDPIMHSGSEVDPSTLLSFYVHIAISTYGYLIARFIVDKISMSGTAATLIPRTTPHGCACNTSWPLQLQQWRPIFGPTLLAPVQGKVPAVVTVLWSSVLELHSELKIPNRQPH